MSSAGTAIPLLKKLSHTRSETDLTTGTKPPLRPRGEQNKTGIKFQRNVSAAQLLQDEFNSKYSSRVSKLPSFMSTNASKFSLTNNLREVGNRVYESTLTSRLKRGDALSRVNSEFSQVHIQRYNDTLSINNTLYDPLPRQKIENQLKDLMPDDTGVMNEDGSLAMTIKEKSTSTILTRNVANQAEDQLLFKPSSFYEDKLRAKSITKKLRLVSDSEPGGDQASFGTAEDERSPEGA